MLEEIRQIKLFTAFLKSSYSLAKKIKIKREKDRSDICALGNEAQTETFGKLKKEHEKK